MPEMLPVEVQSAASSSVPFDPQTFHLERKTTVKFHWGAIPEDDFDPDETWRAIREPDPIRMQLIATPIGIGLLAIFLFLWPQATELRPISIAKEGRILFVIATIFSIPLLIIVHELLHAAAHPRYGLSPESIIGVWPQRLLFYAHFCGELSRNRFLVVFAMPFVAISVFPLVLAWLGLLSPLVSSIFAWFSIWNALFACGDALGFFLILWQVPAHSIVRNKGWRTYWKTAEAK